MADPLIRKLARQLVTVEKRVHDLETVPQLAHSSIDDYALPVYDAEGSVVTKIGKQDDGTWGAPPLAGPTPPAPVGVTAVGGPGTIHVSWTGDFDRDAAPLDFDTLEILVDGTLSGSLPNRDGGTVSISAEQGTRFVSARIRTLVPRHSATTSPFSVEVGPPADQLFVEARERIEEAEGQIQAGKDALEAERAAREAALADAAQNLQDLQEQLDGIADSEELQGLRDQIAAAQEAVEAAQADATAAKTAADNASSEAAAAQQTADDAAASALAAAGIAADKGRIFYQSAEPTGDDRSPNNLWIDSDDGRVYVWNGSAWEESQSEDLRDAAQAAVAAQQAAEAADSKAQAAAAAAAAADAKADAAQTAAEDAADAAAAAQQTADDATLDAREAHNEAVAAQQGVDAAIERGDSLLVNGSFEQGDLGWPTDGSHGGRSRIIEDPGARTGTRVLELTPTTQNTYPESDFIAVEPGQVLRVRGWFKHLGGDGYRVGLLVRHHDANKGYLRVLYAKSDLSVQDWGVGEWTLLEGEVTVPEDVRWFRFAFHATGPTTSTYHADDFQVVDVTEARAAQARAEEAYALAETKPGMDEVNQAIVVSANGKNAITVSADAPTSSTPGAVVGDTWWRVDAAGDIFGQWSWTGSAWSARAVTSEVIANLDVGKLTVTGTSRFTKAVVDRLFADIFAAHKITANELTIAALDEDGEIKPDSIEAVMIKDGQISANKILLLGDPNDPDEAALVATIASIMKLSVENLVVTGGATISEAVIEKFASQMITAGVLRTAETGQRVVIDESGIVMYGVDPDGVEFELVRIGPSGDNLITAGDTTISPDGVQAPSGTFDEIAVGGDDLGTILDRFPRGVVARGSNNVQGRSVGPSGVTELAELSFDVENYRAYQVTVEPISMYASNGAYMHLNIHWTVGENGGDAPAPTMNDSVVRRIASRRQDSGGMVPLGGNFYIQTGSATSLRILFTLTASNGEGTVFDSALGGTLRAIVQDIGPSVPDIMVNRSGATSTKPSTPPPPPPPPAKKKYTKTYNSNGYRVYDNNGNDTSSNDKDVVQGLYAGGPSRLLRKGGWTFPNMTNDLSGATVEKVEMYIYMNHSYYTAGATVNPCVWGGRMVDNLSTFTSVKNWKRNTGKWITLPSNLYNGFKNGNYAGVGVKPTTSYAEQYARFNASGAKIRITYVK